MVRYMVVTCPACGTKFSLEESRIPGAAARVRCSRCQHIFRITREGQVVGPDWEPPAAEPPAVPLPQEIREGAPAFVMPEAAPPEAAPAKAVSPTEAEPQTAVSAAAAETAAPRPKRRLWGWLLAVILLAGGFGGLGWWFFPKKPAPAKLTPEKGVQLPASQVVTPPPPPAPSPDLTDLAVDWAEARYWGLVNTKGRQILVLQGEVVNKGKAPRGPIRLKATLTDAQHKPLREETVYTGTSLTDAELKTLDPGQIKGWLARPGGRSQVRVLKPGEKQPFTVVFFGVPDNLAEARSGFQLVVVEGPTADSSP